MKRFTDGTVTDSLDRLVARWYVQRRSDKLIDANLSAYGVEGDHGSVLNLPREKLIGN